VSTNIEKREQFINEKISKINKKIADLEIELHVLDDEIASHANQRQQYNLLSDICSSLDQLNELGASDLFWGREATGYDPELQLNRVRKVVSEFELKISAIDQSRSLIQEKIQKESLDIFHLNQDLADISEEMERIQNEYTLERKPSEIPFRPMVMPWSRQGEDEKRFRKILLIVFLFSLTLSLLYPYSDIHLKNIRKL
jgi:DNA repair exonuclease SbcCD ATPase subunit